MNHDAGMPEYAADLEQKLLAKPPVLNPHEQWAHCKKGAHKKAAKKKGKLASFRRG